LREKREVKSDEYDQSTQPRPSFRVEAAGYLWPPVVDSAEIGHHGSADHDVVEVSDDKVGVGHVDINAERGYE